jgi:hypothetical protein
MFMNIEMFNHNTQLTGAGLKKLILDRFPEKVLSQMHAVDLTAKTDQELIDIITKTGRTAEKLEEAKKNLSTRTPRTWDKPEWKPKDKFRVNKGFKPRKEFKQRKFVNRQGGDSGKTFATQTEGIPQGEMDRRRKARECMRCAWPAVRKGNHKTMDCYQPIKFDTGTANFSKAQKYQELRVGAYEQEEDQKDLYTEGSDSEELRDTTSGSEESEIPEGTDLTEESMESLETKANWWSDLVNKLGAE